MGHNSEAGSLLDGVARDLKEVGSRESACKGTGAGRTLRPAWLERLEYRPHSWRSLAVTQGLRGPGQAMSWQDS